MSGLRRRQQQLSDPNLRRRSTNEPSEQRAQIALAPTPYFAIVDNELVSVIGAGDVPGMSPVYWCADSEGISAPVPVDETQIFPTAQQALQALERSGRTTSAR